MKFIHAHGFEYRFGAIAEQDIHGKEMLPCASVNDGIGAAGIISYHATDHRAVGCGRFWSEKQTMRFQEHIQLIADHTRLHPYPFFACIQLEDFIKILGDVNDDSMAYNLSG
jgi:hypothetical protein